jgi:hypothetical protein
VLLIQIEVVRQQHAFQRLADRKALIFLRNTLDNLPPSSKALLEREQMLKGTED